MFITHILIDRSRQSDVCNFFLCEDIGMHSTVAASRHEKVRLRRCRMVAV